MRVTAGVSDVGEGVGGGYSCWGYREFGPGFALSKVFERGQSMVEVIRPRIEGQGKVRCECSSKLGPT